MHVWRAPPDERNITPASGVPFLLEDIPLQMVLQFLQVAREACRTRMRGNGSGATLGESCM